MLRGRQIVCLSSIDWDFLWQGHQQIMSALAGCGNRILFVESTGVRRPAVRDAPRLWRRLRGGLGHGARRRRPDNLHVYAPVVLPFPYSRLARAVNLPILRRAIQRATRTWDPTPPIVWNFLPTPLSRSVTAALRPALSIFHCVDDLAASSPGAARAGASEAQCFADADLVFVTSHLLLERARRLNPNAYLCPSGVDWPRFAAARRGPVPPPDDLRALPRPIIGYLGGLHRWVDQALIAAVAARRPEWSFALVGPIQTDVSALTRLPNVHALGSRGPDQVPGCLRGFDVATIPYRLADYTHHVYPAKLNEYLAMGLAVVATPLVEIERFNQDHGNLVAVAGDPAGFETAIETALADRGQAAIERRLAVARANSWETRLELMSALIVDALERRAGRRPGPRRSEAERP